MWRVKRGKTVQSKEGDETSEERRRHLQSKQENKLNRRENEITEGRLQRMREKERKRLMSDDGGRDRLTQK